MKKDICETNSTKDIIFASVASILAITTAFMPNNLLYLKIFGIIAYTIIIFRSTIKRLLNKFNQKSDESPKM